MLWSKIQHLFFCMCKPSCLIIIFWNYYYFPKNGGGDFVENQLAINIQVHFWLSLLFHWLIYLSILMPIPHCVDYCSFVVSFEIGKCEYYSILIVSIWRLFQLFRALAILYELKYWLVISVSMWNTSNRKQRLSHWTKYMLSQENLFKYIVKDKCNKLSLNTF